MRFLVSEIISGLCRMIVSAGVNTIIYLHVIFRDYETLLLRLRIGIGANTKPQLGGD